MVNCGGGSVISLVANLARASEMDTHCIGRERGAQLGNSDS